MTYTEFSAPSAQSTLRVAAGIASVATGDLFCAGFVVTCTAAVFMVRGVAPVAVAQTSAYLAPNIPYRIRGVLPGERLAFITASGAADVYVTPDA